MSEEGMVTIEHPIMSVEAATIHHFLLSSSVSATTLFQDMTNQTHQVPYQQYPVLWFHLMLGCLGRAI